VVGFEVKETMGNKEGLLGAFLGVAGNLANFILIIYAKKIMFLKIKK